MSLCWSGSQLGSRRISHRAAARCGCFAACYPKERLAFGTGRLVLLNSIRTVRREVDSPLVRVIPMSHVMAPSLTPAMPRPCVRMRRTKRIPSLAMDVASADCRKPGQITAITIERARPVLYCSIAPGRGGRTESRSPIRSRSRTGWAPRTRRWRHTGMRRRRRKSPLQEAFIQRREFGRLWRRWYFNTKGDCL